MANNKFPRYFTPEILRKRAIKAQADDEEKRKRELPLLIKKQLEQIILEIDNVATKGGFRIYVYSLYNENAYALRERGFEINYNQDTNKHIIDWR